MDELKIAELYFSLSNKSDFTGIAKLMTDSTTYSSQNTGIYLGSDSIIEMQKNFHGQFSQLKWTVKNVYQEKSGVIRFEYDFSGKKHNGKEVFSSGAEYLLVTGGKIVHIEIKNA